MYLKRNLLVAADQIHRIQPQCSQIWVDAQVWPGFEMFGVHCAMFMPALLEMFQLSWGQSIAWNIEPRELFQKPKNSSVFHVSKEW